MSDRPDVMPFGKYKGEPVEDLPSSYIEWLLSETDVDKRNPRLAAELQAQLDARGGKGIAR